MFSKILDITKIVIELITGVVKAVGSNRPPAPPAEIEEEIGRLDRQNKEDDAREWNIVRTGKP